GKRPAEKGAGDRSTGAGNLKKIPRHTFLQTVAERYAVISTLATQYPVRSLCRVLEVTRSGYYQWRGKLAGTRAQANQQLLEQIRQVFAQHRQAYGSPRVTRELRRQRIVCSENRVASSCVAIKSGPNANAPFVLAR